MAPQDATQIRRKEDMTKLRVLALLAVVALLLVPAFAYAQTPPQPPCRFYGTVTADGAAVPAGTVITATVGGDEYTATTPAEGYGSSSYAIKIEEPDGSSYSGATVSFKIGGSSAKETGTWTLGGNVNVNLSVGEATTPTNGGITNVVVETVAAGQAASATLSNGTLTLKIPAGAKGDTGATGAAGATGAPGEEGPGAPGGIALPIIALVIAIIAIGIAVMGMRRRV
jgi:hypothetical protein